MDEQDASKQIKEMDDEFNENYEYLVQTIDAAATIATRLIKDFSVEHLQMFEKILFSLESRRKHQETIYIAQTVLYQHSGNCNLHHYFD